MDQSLGGDHGFLVFINVGGVFLVAIIGEESGKRFIAAVV